MFMVCEQDNARINYRLQLQLNMFSLNKKCRQILEML